MGNLGIEKKKILVVGDVMLDIYYEGDIERISPEAPVPVFRQRTERYVPGGAANVAANLVAAGQDVTLMSIVGKDENGDRLVELLNRQGISTKAVIRTDRPTTSKTRFLANGSQQVMRSDIEDSEDISTGDADRLIDGVRSRISEFDAVVISDYRKGLLTHRLVREVIDLCRDNRIKILADIKENQDGKYNDIFLLKPNKKELAELTGSELNSDEDVKEAAERLLRSSGCEYVLTTLGAKGMLLVGREECFEVPSVAREVYDVTGAGDTAVSYLTVCIANGMDIRSAVQTANIASGIEVGKVGTSCVSLGEIEKYIRKGQEKSNDIIDSSMKIYDRSKATELRDRLNGKKVVFTNGCFDLLHVGHTRYLNEAKKLGDILIVGVNSDESVKRLKGDERPINRLEDRMEILAELMCVDYVIPFTEDTPYELISEIHPDLLVKGGDYRSEDVVGVNIVKALGGKVEIIPFVPDKSTTLMIERMKKK